MYKNLAPRHSFTAMHSAKLTFIINVSKYFHFTAYYQTKLGVNAGRHVSHLWQRHY